MQRAPKGGGGVIPVVTSYGIPEAALLMPDLVYTWHKVGQVGHPGTLLVAHNRRTGLYLVTGPENLPGVDGVYLANLPTFGAAVDAALLLLLTATDVEDPDVIHDFASLYPKAHITTRKDT